MVYFGPFWPEEVYFGPFRSATRTLATPDQYFDSMIAIGLLQHSITVLAPCRILQACNATKKGGKVANQCGAQCDAQQGTDKGCPTTTIPHMGNRKGTTKKLCDKDIAERSGELSGAICLKTLVSLGNDL